VIGDELLGGHVDLLPDAHLRGAARRIIVADGAALIFGEREQGRVPAIGV